MKDIIINYLKTYKRKTIPLNHLEDLSSGNQSYEEFAQLIRVLMEGEILKPVKSHGTNGKTLPLYNSYRIIRSNLKKALIKEIQNYTIVLNPKIHLDIYFSLGEKEWKADLPFIRKIDSYLNEKGLPGDYATIPERSYQLVGDEKWIDEKDGRRLLDRIRLWDRLKIISVPDPLMLGINPPRLKEANHIHLAVENKATFYALIDSISNTDFTTIIYGAGWKIAANIQMLPKQLGLVGDDHLIYYFGDLDAEGISIWYSLYDKQGVRLAIPFYKALLLKGYSMGKERQKKNILAINNFKCFFSEKEAKLIDELIRNGGYIPQEGLKKEELVDIWGKSQWIFP